MIRKIVFAGVGLAMLSLPLAVSAQTISASNASLIAVLTQLVQVLEQELQELIAMQGVSAPTLPAVLPIAPINSASFTVSPTSGNAPLSVTFTTPGSYGTPAGFVGGRYYAIDFGDGSSPSPVSCAQYTNGAGDCSASNAIQHAYTVAGTYTANLEQFPASTPNNYNKPPTLISSLVITVTGSGLPVIMNAPTSVSLPAGSYKVFSVTATSGATLSYQWQKQDSSGNWVLVNPYATDWQFGISSLQQSDAGTYRVAVTNPVGTVYTGPFTITVN